MKKKKTWPGSSPAIESKIISGVERQRKGKREGEEGGTEEWSE